MDKNGEITGKIIKTKGERAIVEILKKDGREATGETLDVSCPLKTSPGWLVRIKWQKTSKTTDNLLLLLPPVAAVIAGAIFGYHMALRMKMPTDRGILFGALLWGVFGLSYSYKYWRDTYGRGLQPTVVDILKK
ncbi:MAG: hypothetical protein LBP78_03315 [Acidaminococcales bacterium]|nr:hypothetical protein [Acidaminococcales bacterium]